ncbi:MAG: hypothetical protein DDT40_01331 [candidate division WS2 bacterium]|nr:hypothetical protein [Candidatus Psychracetigena formicireducens]
MKFYQIERDFHNGLAASFQPPLEIKIAEWERDLWSYIEKLVGEFKGKTVLDVGCGFGRESILFALREAKVTGIDNRRVCRGR